LNEKILNTGTQDFIFKNLYADTVSVLLKKPILEGVSNKELVEQLEARKKSENKLPTWFRTAKIYYPNKLNIEQTSSEITARYKAGLVKGKSLLDATGGFGVDSLFFSKKVDRVFHCEIDESLSGIAAHNFNLLAAKNIKTVPADGLKFLADSKLQFDWIYLDPSRRNSNKGKVFRLSDCFPNILEYLELLFMKSRNVLLKTSPLLDLSVGLKELQSTREIHVVAANNEVKELLWVLERGFKGSISVKTINLAKKGDQNFDFLFDEEKIVSNTYSGPLSYLYEPNAAVMKSGGFKILGNRFSLKKLQEHTHLYTSDELIDFPGRIFKIEKIVPYNKNSMKQLKVSKANVATRNFPETVEKIRKKQHILDGGNIYLFFIKDCNDKKIVLSCLKL